MWRGGLRIVAGKFRPVGAIAATAAMTPAPAMSEAILAAVTLVVPVGAGVLLRLRATTTATGDEGRQAAELLSAAFVATLRRLLIRLLLMLRPVLHLLIARREWLGVARQIRLALLYLRLRCVARLVLSHEGLPVIVAIVEVVISGALRRAALALLRLLIVVIGVLLAELFLCRCDQAEIVFCVLIVILGRDRVAGTLRVARKLDVFFCNV